MDEVLARKQKTSAEKFLRANFLFNEKGRKIKKYTKTKENAANSSGSRKNTNRTQTNSLAQINLNSKL